MYIVYSEVSSDEELSTFQKDLRRP